MQRLFCIILLNVADGHPIKPFGDEIYRRLQHLHEEGYLLGTRVWLFIANSILDEIKMNLEGISNQYSYLVLDLTDNISEDTFSIQIGQIFKGNSKLKHRFNDLIERFTKMRLEANNTDVPLVKNKINLQDQIDLILDKINKYGKHSLTEQDLKILNSLK